MKMIHFLTKVVVVLLVSTSASADIIFEGYYKLSLATQHIGYFVQRYDLDPKSKTFTSIYYLYTKTDEGVTTESLNAKATSKLEPISYQYTRLDNGKSKVIDAIVKKNKLVIKTVDGGKAQNREIAINDKTFFSTFLSHLILKNPKGIAVGNKFSYEAIAEEDGSVERGEVYVKEQVAEKGLDTFRTLNTFKREEFINWLNIKGESIKTLVPKYQIVGELMANPKEARGDFPFSESTIKLIFGNIPEGKANLLNKK